MFYWLIVLIVILFSGDNIDKITKVKSEKQNVMQDEYSFSYNLDYPDKTYKLPDNLNEISGLSYYKKNKLLCVQDEKATIFVYDTRDKKVKDKYKFGKDGDFEGVELVDKKVYVLRSDGKIYKVKNFKEKDYQKKDYNTELDVSNDCEGLCFDSISNSLLIACKGKPYIDKEKMYNDSKAIYSFDMDKKELKDTPFILINLNVLLNLEDLSKYERLSQKLASGIDESGDIRFQPSGIAVHPITGNIYVIASVGQKLIVLNRKGNILTIQDLNKKIFRQPEGICFKPNGNLYISNEADGGKAKIHYFKYEANH